MRKRADDLQHGAARRPDDVIGDLPDPVHAELVHQVPQAAAGDVVAGGERIEVADDLDRFPDIGADDLEDALVGLAAFEQAHDRNAEPLLEHLAGVRSESRTADIHDVNRRSEEAHHRAVR